MRVKAGDEVIVTERGKPIAKLVPIAQSEAIPEHLREMEKQGLISVGTGKLPKGFWNLPRPKDPKGLVLKAVLEEREDGR
jgi:prevent-host-death family protein